MKKALLSCLSACAIMLAFSVPSRVSAEYTTYTTTKEDRLQARKSARLVPLQISAVQQVPVAAAVIPAQGPGFTTRLINVVTQLTAPVYRFFGVAVPLEDNSPRFHENDTVLAEAHAFSMPQYRELMAYGLYQTIHQDFLPIDKVELVSYYNPMFAHLASVTPNPSSDEEGQGDENEAIAPSNDIINPDL